MWETGRWGLLQELWVCQTVEGGDGEKHGVKMSLATV